MSAAAAAPRARSAAPGRPAPHPTERPAAPRERLRVVGAPAQARTRVPFVVACMAVLASALLGVLLLNTSMAQGAYEKHEMQSRLARSAQEQQRLTAALDQAAAPAHLADAARALGMVPSASGAYLRLSDGVVLGNPAPAGGAG